jgi:Ion channel
MRFLVVVFGALIFDLFGQNPSSDHEKLISRILTSNEITFENLKTTLDSREALIWLKSKFPDQIDSVGRLKGARFITFKNCTFNMLDLSGLSLGQVTFENSRIDNIILEDSQLILISAYRTAFESLVISKSDVEKVEFSYLLPINTAFNDIQTTSISDSRLGYVYVGNPSIDLRLKIVNSVLKGSPSNQQVFYFGNSAEIAGSELATLELMNSTFGMKKSIAVNDSTFNDSTTVNIQGRFRSIAIDSCTFNSHVNFYSSSVADRLYLYSNNFFGLVAFNNSNLPADLNLRWSQLAGRKLSRFHLEKVWNTQFRSYATREYFQMSDAIGISKLDHFESIMRMYQSLYAHYKSVGDLESANGCYTEMKDVQTERFEYLFGQERTFKSYFRWKLSQLIKFYTEHGTDPARAIVVSIWVIISFAFVYFFFPSDWDISNKSKLLKDFKRENRQGKSFLKILVSFTAGILLSSINALTLSLNSFTTLGFGNIPAHGVAKYFCVIEGFIGWFLLSIFTVALINQVLG